MTRRSYSVFNILLLVWLSFVSINLWADDTETSEETEEEALVLPTVSLKYSQLYYLKSGLWDKEREVSAPLLYADDGKLYGISSHRILNGTNGILFRVDPQGATDFYSNTDGVDILHEFEHPNTLNISPVQSTNGDIIGVADISTQTDRYREEYKVDGIDTSLSRWVYEYEGPGLVVYRLPAGDPDNFQILDIIRDEDRPYLQMTTPYSSHKGAVLGNLTVNPVDGHIYGLTYSGNSYSDLYPEVGAAVFRIRSDASALEIIYRFGAKDEEDDSSIRYSPLSITSESDGTLAIMMKGGPDISNWEGDPDEIQVGGLFRLNPNDPPEEGELQPVHRFTKAEVYAFTSADGTGNPPHLGNGYLVDVGNGWWYGNAGELGGELWKGSVGADDRGMAGRIFRIRHDGSDFEVVHEFVNTCSEETEAFVDPDRYLGLTQDEYNALSTNERLERKYAMLFANDDCHRDWAEGKHPMGPLLMADDGLIYGTSRSGGMPIWEGVDVRPEDSEDPSDYVFAESFGYAIGTVFRLFPEYVEEDGAGFQLVRPFRKPLGENREAAHPGGLIQGPDQKLYGISEEGVSAQSATSGGANILYSLEFNAADIDMTSTATTDMLPGDVFTISWWAYQVTRCEAFSRTVEGWNGELQITGSKTLSTDQAGNHRLEIFCQNDDGTVYMEKAFTVSVNSPPLTEEQYLELFNYEHDGAGSFSFSMMTMLLLLIIVSLYRRKIFAVQSFFKQKTRQRHD